VAFDKKSARLSKRIEEIYAAHPEALNPSEQEDLEIGRRELLALFGAQLGAEYNPKKVNQVTDLHRGLQEARLYLGRELATGRISREHFLKIFNELMSLTFERCQEILGKKDFERLFGGSVDQVRHLIEPSIFLGLEARERVAELYGADLPAAGPLVRGSSAQPPATDSFPHAEVERFFELCLTELAALRHKLDLRALGRAVAMIRSAEAKGGRVHVTGVGKPEHVARYVASLLCSVGTLATFLHATETLHGSLGQVHRDDVVIAVSNSGNTVECCAAAAAVKEHGAQLIAVTGNASSELARMADLVLHAPIDREGGVLGLAPRISVLGEIYVLAGLSVALEAARGLTLEEYSRWHRAGTLGQAARKLVNNRARGSN